MYDPHTRESRGFGFVTMETAEEADAAITALNATEFMGKVMNVEKVMHPPHVSVAYTHIFISPPGSQRSGTDAYARQVLRPAEASRTYVQTF